MSQSGKLLEQVESGLPAELRERFFSDPPVSGVHLAVMREPFLSFLLAGSKTIESRFSINRVDPFDRVSDGDLVVLKAGLIVGAFVVKTVRCRELAHGDIGEIRDDFNSRIQATNDFWDMKSSAKFATLMEVDELFTFDPFQVDKRDMRGWVVLRQSVDELALVW
jgi:hypothetical protein